MAKELFGLKAAYEQLKVEFESLKEYQNTCTEKIKNLENKLD